MEMEKTDRGSFPEPPSPIVLFRRQESPRDEMQRFSISNPAMASSTRDLWDQLFFDGYMSDVCIQTNGGTIKAHSIILGIASPVIQNMLRRRSGRSISIRGVPHQAVRAFIRLIYSSCYERQEVNQYVLHLLVLSHVFVVPRVKQFCLLLLENNLLNTENVVDVLQLALLCDAPRLHLICHRFILRNFSVVSATEGWKVMKQCEPELAQELREAVIEADLMEKKRVREMEQKKIYLQLYNTLEAIVHICEDGCQTIRPHDKGVKVNYPMCDYQACKRIESLVRHLVGCKAKASGGCLQCKRMWQLLQLHSRMCTDTGACGVPLCRQLKKRGEQPNEKVEMQWVFLVSKLQQNYGKPYKTSSSKENIDEAGETCVSETMTS